jgi:hypothetical protein
MFKKSFLKMRIKSQLKKNKTMRFSQPYKNIKSVGIIFTADDRRKHEQIKSFIKMLEHDGKEIMALCYLPPKKENLEFLFNYYTKKDLNFWGKIESDDVVKFINEPFDLLFNPDSNADNMLKYILAASKAKCRIGKANDKQRSLFEMMIDTHNSNNILTEEMYKYTNRLK